MLNSLSNTRLEAHAVAIEAILKSYPQIIEALEYLQEDYSPNGDARREAENMQMRCMNWNLLSCLSFWKKFCNIFI